MLSHGTHINFRHLSCGMEVEITVTIAFILWSRFLYLAFFFYFGFLSILNLIFRAHLFWDFVLSDPMFPVVLIFIRKGFLNLRKRSLNKAT